MANRQQIELANVDGAHPVTRDTDGRSWLFPLSSHETLEQPQRGLGTSDPSSFIYKTNLNFLFVFLVFSRHLLFPCAFSKQFANCRAAAPSYQSFFCA
jgi:hypothetical protein